MAAKLTRGNATARVIQAVAGQLFNGTPLQQLSPRQLSVLKHGLSGALVAAIHEYTAALENRPEPPSLRLVAEDGELTEDGELILYRREMARMRRAGRAS